MANKRNEMVAHKQLLFITVTSFGGYQCFLGGERRIFYRVLSSAARLCKGGTRPPPPPRKGCVVNGQMTRQATNLYAPRRRSTIEVHAEFSGAPHLRSSIPYPKTYFSKNQISSR